MPSTKTLQSRNCICITILLYFHLELKAHICYSKNVWLKTDKAGLYNLYNCNNLILMQLKELEMSWGLR